MSQTLLLVEDNVTDEKLALRAFQRSDLGAEIVVARDGAEALDYLFGTGSWSERAQPLPAVVLLDLKIPKIDGLEVLRRLRAHARTRLVPVVVLTTSRQAEDLLQSYSLGANAYVRKPVDFGAFVETAKALGRFWLVHNEAPPTPEGSDR